MDKTDTPENSGALNERLDALFAPFGKSDGPGLVVSIKHGEELLLRRAYGLASVQQNVANTTATRMRIGSTSKHFTCLAALLLAEDGKLNIDAPVTEYLPELPTHKTVPTLRQLMTHTGGYRCSLDVGTALNGFALQPKGWTLKALANQREYNFEPGCGQMYNNGGYHLLSIVIDRVAGTSMETFLRERVFEPMGMLDTQCVPSDFEVVPGMAALHMPLGDGRYRQGFFSTDEVRGEGNIVSTIDDMQIWLDHLIGDKRVGSDETWRQMLEAPVLSNGLQTIYSLGLYRHDYRGLEVLHHAGAVIGGNSQMLAVPEHKLTVAIMCNGAPVSAQELTRSVVDLVLEEHINEPKSEIAPFERFKQLGGCYYHGEKSGVLVQFAELGDRLGFSFQGSPLLPVLKEKDGALHAGFEDVALGPLVFDDLGSPTDDAPPKTISYAESGEPDSMKLLPDTPPDAESLKEALLGNYRCDEFFAEVQIARDGDDVILSVRGDYSPARRFRIEPKSETACLLHSLDEPGAASALTVRTIDEVVTRFDIDVIRARHIGFLRR